MLSEIEGGESHQSFLTQKMSFPSKVTPVSIEKTASLGSGFEGVVSRVTATVESNDSRRSIPLAYKEVSRGFHAYEELFSHYYQVKDAGLPVPTTFRATEDKKGIFMTDLTRGGENVVISTNDIGYERVQELYEKYPQLMQNFSRGVDIYSETENTSLIDNQCMTFAHRGAESGLVIPHDAWFLVIKPNGDYDWIVGDFGAIRGSTAKPDVLYERNMDSLINFRSFVSLAQQYGLDPEAVKNDLETIDKGRVVIKEALRDKETP